MTTWIPIAMQSLVLFALLSAFGALFLFAGNVRAVKTYVFAPLLSIALLGVLTLGSYVYTWTIINVALLFILALLICFAFRKFVERNKFIASIKYQFNSLTKQFTLIKRSELAAIVLGMLASFVATLYIFRGISLDSPIGIQGYDNPFHFSVVRHILESGIASPIGAGSIMGNASAIYPSLWHSFVALSAQLYNSGIIESAWSVCIMCIGLIAPLGIVLLTKILFKQTNIYTLFIAAVLPSITTGSLFNYFASGSLFANLMGLTLVPLALACIMYLHNALSSCSLAKKVSVLFGACLCCIFALGLAHPSTVFVLFIFLVPYTIANLQSFWKKLLLVCGVIIFWNALMRSSFLFRTINCTDRIGDDIGVGQWYSAKLGIDYLTLSAMPFLPIFLFLVCLVASLVIAALLRKKFSNSWYIVSIAFVFSQLACSLFPENWFSIVLTGFWYRDYPRFLVIFIFMASPLLAYIPTLLEFATKKVNAFKTNTLLRNALVIVVSLCCVLFAARGNSYKSWLAYSSTSDALTSQEISYCEQVAKLTDGAVVLNNADDNSVWMYPSFGINALLKGRPASQMSPMSENLCALIEGIDRIGEDSAYGEQLRNAAKEINLSYVVKMSDKPAPTMRFTNLNQVIYQPDDAITRINPQTAGLELVYELNNMQLYKLAY